MVEAPDTIPAQVTVDNSDVFKCLQKLPQKRLGAVVYIPDCDIFDNSLEGRENCLIQVRIGNKYLSTEHEAVKKRKVWGTEVYTDDSDIVAVLFHSGKLKEEDIKDRDCVATLRVCPRLHRYGGSLQNGINSRSWLVPHDGVSVMVDSIDFIAKGRAELTPHLVKKRLQDWEAQRDLVQHWYPQLKPSHVAA